jgi:hypothetical protein
MEKISAEIVNQEMLAVAARLNESVAVLVDHLSAKDASIYKLAVAELLGAILLDFLNPIYKEHPYLKPSELD